MPPPMEGIQLRPYVNVWSKFFTILFVYPPPWKNSSYAPVYYAKMHKDGLMSGLSIKQDPPCKNLNYASGHLNNAEMHNLVF